MPEKWDDAREKRLLLEVIAICNTTVERSAWEGVAAVMGEGTSAEACRQKFQAIKRNLKTANGTTASTPKTATKTKTPASANGTNNRKRKAADANIEDLDDDEELAYKSPKIKKERRANTAEVFKAEENDGEEGVDVERDDLYDEAA